mmetsp:Transcript_117906/g.380547  ORF Transcript_117906/g.380547 Transcript_117906/m.380547 type:complete len:218 (-) Transcript_117906:899-1552(-)
MQSPAELPQVALQPLHGGLQLPELLLLFRLDGVPLLEAPDLAGAERALGLGEALDLLREVVGRAQVSAEVREQVGRDQAVAGHQGLAHVLRMPEVRPPQQLLHLPRVVVGLAALGAGASEAWEAAEAVVEGPAAGCGAHAAPEPLLHGAALLLDQAVPLCEDGHKHIDHNHHHHQDPRGGEDGTAECIHPPDVFVGEAPDHCQEQGHKGPRPRVELY